MSALGTKKLTVRKSYAVESPGKPLASQEIEKEEFKKDGRKTTLGQQDDIEHGGGLDEDSIDFTTIKSHNKRNASENPTVFKDLTQLRLQNPNFNQARQSLDE